MELDEEELAQQAAGKRTGRSSGRKLAPTLDKANPDLLRVQMADTFIQHLFSTGRDHVEKVLDKLPEEQRPSIEEAMQQYAAACAQQVALQEFNVRANSYRNRAESFARKVYGSPSGSNKDKRGTPTRIKEGTARLFEHKPARMDDAVSQLKSMLDQAEKKLSDATEPGALSLELSKLLKDHKAAKKTRATTQDFAQHSHLARQQIIRAMTAAHHEKDYQLAFELLEAIRHHEQEMAKFFAMAENIGFESARDLYLNKGNPLLGMSESAWQLAASIAASKDHAAVFRELLAKDLLPKKLFERKEDDTTAAKGKQKNSSESPGSDSKRQKRDAADGLCAHCRRGNHAQADCRLWRSHMREITRDIVKEFKYSGKPGQGKQ